MQPTKADVAAAIQAANKQQVVDLPIARIGHSEKLFVVSHRKAFVKAQLRDAELQKLQLCFFPGRTPTTDELLGELPRIRLLAQLA